jgi:Zn-finger nucleic acid-binding protein
MQGTWDGSEKKLSFELKYCERCGGLWLRPAGGEQIYCVGCGRAMAEMPERTQKAEPATGVEEEEFWRCKSGERGAREDRGGRKGKHDGNAAGGVA